MKRTISSLFVEMVVEELGIYVASYSRIYWSLHFPQFWRATPSVNIHVPSQFDDQTLRFLLVLYYSRKEGEFQGHKTACESCLPFLLFADLFLYSSPCISLFCQGASVNQRDMTSSRKSLSMSHFTLLPPICFCLLSFLLTRTTIATPAPVPAPTNGDPCGPTVQDNPNYPDTCSVAPVLVKSPETYGVNCTAVSQVKEYEIVSWGNCSASFQDACTKALDTRTRTGVWIWSELALGCAVAFFLPPYQGAAQLQNNTRCLEIFTAMNDSCSTSVPASNFGSVNLRTLPGKPPSIVNGQAVYDGYPDSDVLFYGNAVNVGYPSYAISFTPSTDPNA